MESERSVEPAEGDAKTNVKRALWDDDGDWIIGEQRFHQQAKGLQYCNQPTCTSHIASSLTREEVGGVVELLPRYRLGHFSQLQQARRRQRPAELGDVSKGEKDGHGTVERKKGVE